MDRGWGAFPCVPGEFSPACKREGVRWPHLRQEKSTASAVLFPLLLEKTLQGAFFLAPSAAYFPQTLRSLFAASAVSAGLPKQEKRK